MEKEKFLGIVDEVIDSIKRDREKRIKSKARRNFSLLENIRNRIKFKVNNL